MRKPNFRYFWENINHQCIVANVRTDGAVRHNQNTTEETEFTYRDWIRMSNDGFHDGTFPITRAQFRLFKRTGEQPKFSYLNKRPTA